MDLKELQDLIKKEKGKIIIVEDGEPTMVILSYEEYKNRGNGNESNEDEKAEPLPEDNGDSEELTVDDLPL